MAGIYNLGLLLFAAVVLKESFAYLFLVATPALCSNLF
ncbi:hypothetical protein VPHD184_0061 [Vibrio phage D184]